ncbi:hypothetical protein FHL15_004179 [Xylaria flabelliformis]|uniref:Uncharacterized protein n=1 Tax=Xylaria flabelliformis TaxID=2512241 RepID=A0A553I4G3_9PEZI|nr:hypothetical protein FHL15_004179 [Xylaria flabelliformis]
MGSHNSLAMPRLSILIPWGKGGAKGSLPVALLAAAPIVLPVAYMVYVLRQSAQRTTASATITPPDPLVGKPLKTKENSEAGEVDGGSDTLAILPAVLAAPDNYVISRERIVSEAIPLDEILVISLQDKEGGIGTKGRRRGLLETYLATTMRMFTWTPQAFVMKSMVSRLSDGAAHAKTFSSAYLDACTFEAGDRVCGVYRVRERVRDPRGMRIVLDLSPPEGWKGPVVSGVLDCGFFVEKKGDESFVRFVNETVLWRRKDEKPTLLEGTVSRWLHTLMVGWMMVRGVEAVTGKNKAMTA